MRILCGFSAVLRAVFTAWLVGLAIGFSLGTAAAPEPYNRPEAAPTVSGLVPEHLGSTSGKEVAEWKPTSTSC